MSRLPFYSDCVGWPERFGAALLYLVDESVECARSTMLRRTEMGGKFGSRDGLARPLGRGVHAGAAYFRLPGWPLYYFSHSMIEYVFAEEATVRLLHAHAVGALTEEKAARVARTWRS